jgi:hypothetical protein
MPASLPANFHACPSLVFYYMSPSLCALIRVFFYVLPSALGQEYGLSRLRLFLMRSISFSLSHFFFFGGGGVSCFRGVDDGRHFESISSFNAVWMMYCWEMDGWSDADDGDDCRRFEATGNGRPLWASLSLSFF